jgi:glycosyltransferase involved in cell wall biosynthesis
MRFSIVIPSYNQAPFLQDCLSSVIGQTGVDLEVLVFDGGSKDGSSEIIEQYADRLAYRQSKADGGQAAAIRDGFERATGDLLGWVNSDDVLLPDALSTAGGFFARNPETPLIYGDALWIDSTGKVIRTKREIDFNWRIFAYGYCYLPQPSVFFRRDAYLKAGGIDPDFECCMDYDLYHRMANLGPIAHVPAFLSCIRNHPGTKTNRMKKLSSKELETIKQRYLRCTRAGFWIRHIGYRALRVLLKYRAGCFRGLSSNEAEAVRTALQPLCVERRGTTTAPGCPIRSDEGR